MDHLHISNELERTGSVLLTLLQNRERDFYTWRPAPEKWCLLEVLCHLVDEEQFDFRARVHHTLETPDSAMLPIDPEGWVKERKYMDQDYERQLDLFSSERRKSVEWLRNLKNPDWGRAYDHPKLGKMTAALFLENWLAHDLLHIRQIVRMQFQHHQERSESSLDYAGSW